MQQVHIMNIHWTETFSSKNYVRGSEFCTVCVSRHDEPFESIRKCYFTVKSTNKDNTDLNFVSHCITRQNYCRNECICTTGFCSVQTNKL